MSEGTGKKPEVGTEVDTYDSHIKPAETAAREEREGGEFKRTHTTDQSADPATKGMTVDKEGLANVYPIEPEPYVNEPGDLREEQEEEAAERARQLEELGEDEEGRLGMGRDTRHKGQGQI